MKKYIDAIRQKVCAICCDSDFEGNCTLNEKEICAVEHFLPKIVESVQSIESDDIYDYYQELKATVCKECRTQEDNGNCYLRDDVNCSLDRYFPLIVETIQEVDSQLI
ncbi:MAG: hypothetical protein K9J12_08295 [Melioribacteraceae bacterium]|nr:hypothetical protein [Melioribacteraceae bacterium]MCF8265392.1 hypothetical protein [Melioribacteraceae bacterium]MCF8412036.1 hypothetical protein [Melioribacteraceae bacterium]